MRKGNNIAKCDSVMLIDDSQLDNYINRQMIKVENFAKQVFIYSNGKCVLEFFKILEQTENLNRELIPDYIFLDINIPIMDGFQFLLAFEKCNKLVKEKCKIVILTNSMNPLDKERLIKNRFVTGFVNKPITKEDLDKLLETREKGLIHSSN